MKVRYFFILILSTIAFSSCSKHPSNPNSHLSLEEYKSLSNESYSISSKQVWKELNRLSGNDEDSMLPDSYARRFYRDSRSLLWVNRKGFIDQADSLVNYLQRLDSIGLNPSKFRLSQMQEDLSRIKQMDFDQSDNRINKLIARLEYNLTKAYLRYTIGQHFGFVNAMRTFNTLDPKDDSSTPNAYHILIDSKIPYANRLFVDSALNKIRNDSIMAFLRSIEPKDSAYHLLVKRLHTPGLSVEEKRKVQINIERCRWQTPDNPWLHRKYILVNLPSHHLQAFDGDSVLDMRIAYGKYKTKTPLIYSKVKRMDINPQWIMPKSIAKTSVIPRLGNSGYFASRNYFFRHRATGKIINARNVSRSMVENGECLVIQRGGKGNALGRIIFRFDNNNSIYLHDTSSRDVFKRDSRDVSHGCIRVQKPFMLAKFLLKTKDEELIDKIGYSMSADVSPLGMSRSEMTASMKAVSDTLKRSRLIGKVDVEPEIPIFIVYYTRYPDRNGAIVAHQDVYGFDEVIYRVLRNYL